jgi:asparagine synthase (glutamine-hydrolysing)
LADDILAKVDKVSMAASVEARVPLLDHKLAEFAIGLPFNLKTRGLTTKYALRKILAKKLPDKIVNRPKHAFDIPAAQWFRHDLKELVRSMLLDDTAMRRPYFNHDFIRTLTEEHFSGQKDHNQKIWNLLCLELWHRIYIDKTLKPAG